MKDARRKSRGDQVTYKTIQAAALEQHQKAQARVLTESSKTRSRVIIMCSGILKATSPASKVVGERAGTGNSQPLFIKLCG